MIKMGTTQMDHATEQMTDIRSSKCEVEGSRDESNIAFFAPLDTHGFVSGVKNVVKCF